MGVVASVGYDFFPKQGKFLGESVTVCFRYDTDHTLKGKIVRDDKEEPYRMIIALEDGRFVEAAECMYSLEPR